MDKTLIGPASNIPIQHIDALARAQKLAIGAESDNFGHRVSGAGENLKLRIRRAYFFTRTYIVQRETRSKPKGQSLEPHNYSPQDIAQTDRKGKTRVLVLTSTLPRWEGDSEPRFVLDLCRFLQPHLDVLVLAPHTHGSATREVLEGVRVERFRYFFSRWQAVAKSGGILASLRANPWRMLQLPFFLAASLLAMRRLIREWSPDVIHAHWIVPQGFVAVLGARDIPILCTGHGGDIHALRGPVLGNLKAWILRRCAATTVVSQSLAEQVQCLAGDRPVHVIPMGTDLSTLFIPPPGGMERDSEQLLFVGRLVEKKGVDCLLDAISRIHDREIRLTIVGEGPLKSFLQRRAQDLGIAKRVRFAGSVPHSELPAYYQRAALAVFPFTVAEDGDQEGFGLVAVEAMGCGCPVIAGDLPALRHNILPGESGLLTPPGDAAALADMIRTALADSLLRSSLSAAALVRVRAHFDWKSIANEYAETLDGLAERTA